MSETVRHVRDSQTCQRQSDIVSSTGEFEWSSQTTRCFSETTLGAPRGAGPGHTAGAQQKASVPHAKFATDLPPGEKREMSRDRGQDGLLYGWMVVSIAVCVCAVYACMYASMYVCMHVCIYIHVYECMVYQRV